MKRLIAIIAIASLTAFIVLSSCKSNKSSKGIEQAVQTAGKTEIQATPQDKNLDVVAFANLYCKTTDLDKARIFLGKTTDSLFTVTKDVENNYACVSADTQYENSLAFYMWTDKDGEKILGVNLTETGEKGSNKRSLQFFTYDSRLNLAVPCKRLNEVITTRIMSMRKNISTFVIRIPDSPEDENITLKYWEKKDKEKYHDLVFVWDGKTFNVE